MIAFPTDMATMTQGQHLQLAHDLKVTNTILETSKDSFMKAPPFRREEAMDANNHLNQGSPEPVMQAEDAAAVLRERLSG